MASATLNQSSRERVGVGGMDRDKKSGRGGWFCFGRREEPLENDPIDKTVFILVGPQSGTMRGRRSHSETQSKG